MDQNGMKAEENARGASRGRQKLFVDVVVTTKKGRQVFGDEGAPPGPVGPGRRIPSVRHCKQ